MTQDLISGHNQAFILKKILQQFKFLSGKLFQFALIADFMTGYINPEVFAVQFPLLVLSCAAPENCFYPGYQFHHSKWFGHIIICSRIQSHDLVIFCTLCRNHDDRNIFGSPGSLQLLQDLHSIFSREHNVQKDQFRQAFFHRCVKLHSCLKPFCLESGCLQGIDKKLPDVSFIFHTVDHSTSLSVRYTGCFFVSRIFIFSVFSITIFLLLHKPWFSTLLRIARAYESRHFYQPFMILFFMHQRLLFYPLLFLRIMLEADTVCESAPVPGRMFHPGCA